MMITFRCDNCGALVKAGDDRAGARGKCRRCGATVTVPRAPSPQEPDPIKPVTIPDDAFEPPPARFFPDSPIALQHGDEPTRKRLLSWPIDIWLYPTSRAGLIMLAILVGVPLILNIFTNLIAFWSCLFFVLYLLLSFVMFCYALWYIAECIRDSADGGVRAPETMAKTPGIQEIVIQWLKLLLTVGLCFLPLILYGAHSRTIDSLYWVVFGACVFVMPMALLSVVMFDALVGLSPLLLILSILSTFIPYCGLVILWAFIGILITLVAMPGPWMPLFGGYLLYAGIVYLSLVAAHLLGAFYHRYEERLNWEV